MRCGDRLTVGGGMVQEVHVEGWLTHLNGSTWVNVLTLTADKECEEIL